MENFLHMTNFSPQTPFVMFVTNIRYGLDIEMHWRTEAQPELGELGASVHLINLLYPGQAKL